MINKNNYITTLLYLLTLNIFTLVSHYTWSQTPQLQGRFKHYTSQNGLSQNDIRAIFQDSDGYIWIGTHGGLNRFDGYSFKKYIRNENKHYNISSNLISSIDEDTLGNLWIGTDDMGLMQYDKYQDKFIHYSNREENLLTDNHIKTLFCDSKNTIWALTEKGLNIIRRNNGKVSIDKHHFNDNMNFGGYEDPKGNIWFGTRKGLIRYIGENNKGEHQFINYKIDGLNEVRYISSNDSSLLVSNNYGLFMLPFKGLESNKPILHSIVKARQINQHLSDANGNIWYTTQYGLFVTFKENEELRTKQFKNLWNNANSLSGDITTVLLEDNNNLIWIGTNGNGLNQYNPRKKNFEHYSKTNDPGSLGFNKIRAITKDSQDNLWFGTEGGAVSFIEKLETKYNFNSGFKTINVNPKGQNFVYAIEEARFENKNKIFIGTGYNANFIVAKINKEIGYDLSIVDEHPDAPVFCIIQDSKKNIWAGTYNGGLYYFEMDAQGEILNMHHFNTKSGINSDIVRSIAEDNNGNIWIGTDNGINKLINGVELGKKSKIVSYKSDFENPNSLSYNYILPLFTARSGEIWVGTLGGGLNKIIPGDTPSGDQFTRITVKDGLPSNVVKAIEEDEDGNLWLATNHGLSKFNPSTHEIVNYGINDGLQDLEFGELASITLDDGQMIFGGVNGFNTFYPKEIKSDKSKINIVFNTLTVLNTEVITNQKINGRVLLDKSINKAKKVNLNYDENSFSVSFSGLNFISPNNNKYAYILENFEEKWTQTNSEQRIAKYTNIPPGRYVLKVKASNADGNWNDVPKSLVIEISPPIWSTPAASVVYLMLFLLALWFFRKYTIITHFKKSQLLIEHLEKEKIEEISQLKLKFYTNVSHEFRTPLTLILGLVDRLKMVHNQLSSQERENYFAKIYRNSQVLLNLINQLLDFRKVEQGKMPLAVAEGDINHYIKLLKDNFNELAKRKNIEYSLINEDTIYGYFDKEILERILFNLLSNAFKFTKNEGEIIVTLEKLNDEYFNLEITDTGVGISEEMQLHLFERFANSNHSQKVGTGIGLSYTKSLVELYHGEISFISKKDVGTKFTLKLPFSKSLFRDDEISTNIHDLDKFNKDVNWLLETEGELLKPKHDPQKENTVLFVEDNDDILFYLEDHFKNSYNILVAGNGKEALEKCLDEHIDIIVSDVMMPEMDGFEFCEKLKEDERINHIPVILLTARKSTDEKLKGFEKGADAYIGKPFEMSELETRIASLLLSRKRLLKKIRKNIDLKPKEIEITSLDEKFLKRLMSTIEQNIGETEFTVEMLAKECGMSQLHLNKKLKILVGQTANAFVRSIRLKRAAQLLAKERYSVNEVMYEVGFLDAKYFRSCFKKEFGKTPSEYQKQHTLV